MPNKIIHKNPWFGSEIIILKKFKGWNLWLMAMNTQRKTNGAQIYFSTKISGKNCWFCVSFFAWKTPMSWLQKLWGQRLSKVYENQDVHVKGKPKS